MNKTKHTPGPWYEASMGNDHQGLVVDEQTGENIAVIYDKANARLIAKAPKMLETLNEVIAKLADYQPDYRAGQKKHKTYSRNDGLVLSSLSSLVNARDQAAGK